MSLNAGNGWRHSAFCCAFADAPNATNDAKAINARKLINVPPLARDGNPSATSVVMAARRHLHPVDGPRFTHLHGGVRVRGVRAIRSLHGGIPGRLVGEIVGAIATARNYTSIGTHEVIVAPI